MVPITLFPWLTPPFKWPKFPNKPSSVLDYFSIEKTDVKYHQSFFSKNILRVKFAAKPSQGFDKTS